MASCATFQTDMKNTYMFWIMTIRTMGCNRLFTSCIGHVWDIDDKDDGLQYVVHVMHSSVFNGGLALSSCFHLRQQKPSPLFVAALMLENKKCTVTKARSTTHTKKKLLLFIGLACHREKQGRNHTYMANRNKNKELVKVFTNCDRPQSPINHEKK